MAIDEPWALQGYFWVACWDTSGLGAARVSNLGAGATVSPEP